MTIRAKLFMIVVLIALISLVISGTSYMSMSFIKTKLSYLTEKSTPFQIRTLELQRATQVVSSNLFKIGTVKTKAELEAFKAEAEKSISDARKVQNALAAMSSEKYSICEELESLYTSLSKTMEAHLAANESADNAGKAMTQQLASALSLLKSLDASIKNLQMSSSSRYLSAVGERTSIAGSQSNLANAKALVNELLLQVYQAGGENVKRHQLHAKTLLNRLQQNFSVRGNSKIRAEARKIAAKVEEYFSVMMAGDKAKGQELAKEINSESDVIISMLAAELENASEKIVHATNDQDTTFTRSAISVNSLAANSELSTRGTAIEALVMKLIHATTTKEVDALQANIETLYAGIAKTEAELEQNLKKIEASKELGMFNKTRQSLASIRSAATASGGIASKVRSRIKLKEEMLQEMAKVNEIVVRLSEKSKKTEQTAQGEQEKSIVDVNRMIHRSLAIILVIGGVGLLVGIVFGLWINSSIGGAIRGLRSESSRLTEAAIQGQLSTRGDIKAVPSEFQGIISGMNETLDALIAPLNMAAEYVARIAKGDVPPLITATYHGDFNTLKENINTCIDAVNALITDANTLSQAAVAGQLTTRAEVEHHHGDFRRIIDGVNKTLDAVIEPIAEVQHILGRMSEGDLTQRMSGYVQGDFQTLKDSLNHALAQLSDAIGKVTVNARQVAAATGQTSSAIGQISDGSQNQMNAISQVATAVKQTANSIVDVAHNTEEASLKSRGSVAIVNSGLEKMNQMVEVVNSIAANSEKINRITDVIEKIANKTNLLSLNAAIEAARAGEHGRGFAVVAEEVGKLAANAAESTQEIMILVEQAVKDANHAVASVKEVSVGMQQIADGALETDAMLQRISVALEQQSAAVKEVNANVNGLSKVAESNATAAEEITATVFELARIADNTRQEAEQFRI